MNFLQLLKIKNPELFYFGFICLVFSIFCLLLAKINPVHVSGANAWIKPFKFAFSTFLYSWAMAWFCSYLKDFHLQVFNWGIILLLGFEIIYIAIQAGRGQLSHFNISSPFYATMYSLMAFAASAVTVWTAYIAWLFFKDVYPNLPDYYLWSIRLGLVIFVIFSFEGFVMGSALKHTIGAPDGGLGLPLLNWSTSYGDPRVAHFIGMHALQVLPILSFYVLKNTKLTIAVAILYGFLAFFTLVQALNGKPFIAVKKNVEVQE